jgi:hypothetical protein
MAERVGSLVKTKLGQGAICARVLFDLVSARDEVVSYNRPSFPRRGETCAASGSLTVVWECK